MPETTQPTPRRVGFFAAVLWVLVLVAALAVAVGAASPRWIDVTVEGRATKMPSGATVGDLIEQRVLDMVAGDVVDLHGAMILEGEGDAAEVFLNDKQVDADTRLHTGDVVWSVPGNAVVDARSNLDEPPSTLVAYKGREPLIVSSDSKKARTEDLSAKESTSTPAAKEATSTPAANAKAVALTFDDGPWPVHTQQVLEILEREEVTATFFMIGRQVARNADLARQVAEEGHLIGNHSLSHAYLHNATPELALSEIENAQSEIEKVLGIRPTWYRPAGGLVSPAVWEQVRASKLRLILWTVDPKDYRCTSAVVLARRVIDTTEPGSVILLHDGGGDRTVTVAALTTIIRELKSQGYTFVTLDELIPE